jgi:hypothetical protein
VKKSLLIILPLIIVISGWFILTRDPGTATPAAQLTVDTLTTDQSQPTSLQSATVTEYETSIQQDTGNSVTSVTQEPVAERTLSDAPVTTLNADTASLGYEPLSDEAFKQIQNRLRTEPDYLTSVLLELRSNTDPNRAKQLAALLADINDPRVYETAAELAYSGDPASQLAGLDLLNRIQTRSSDARDVAIQLLGTESNPEILVATMNVIATPTASATAEQRQLISDNLFLLSNHHVPEVRAHSLSVLGQWEKQNPAVTEALSSALQDTDAHVRARAVYALNGTANIDDTLTENLLLVLENTDESKATREAAMFILQDQALGGSNLRRFTMGQRSLRTRKPVN